MAEPILYTTCTNSH